MFSNFLKNIFLLSAAASTSVFAANPVDMPIIDRGLELHIQPFAEALAVDGRVLRLNTIVTQGDQVYVTAEEGEVFNITNGQSTLVFDFSELWPLATGRSLNSSNSWHGGLRGIAFSPDFESDKKIYTAAMENRTSNPASHHFLSDVDSPVAADSVVSEWTVVDGQIDPYSYRELFRIGMPVFDHPIKDLVFGPDGMLYVTHGDASVQSATAGGGMLNDALGKILRIDPTPSDTLAYTVPSDNPFVGDPDMLDEVWSLGHRNPHTISFTNNGVLIVGEVGRDNIDEINVIKKGSNYGWPEREGTFVHLESGGIINGVEALPSDDENYGYVYPVAQYGHEGNIGAGFVGQAIAGGFAVENNSPISGEYFYGEFATVGDIYHLALSDINVATTSGAPESLTQVQPALATLYFDDDSNPITPAILKSSFNDIIEESENWTGEMTLGKVRSDMRFGKGPNGEVYISSKRNGLIYLVTSSLPGGPGGFSEESLSTIQAESGVTVGSSSVTQEHSGYTGTGAVHSILTTGSGVEGLSINSSTGGTTTLSIRYAMGLHGPAGTTRTLGVLVNGERQAQASFSSTGAWDSWATATVSVSLNTGDNVIDFVKQSQDTGWVNLDSINVLTVGTQIEAESGVVVGASSVTQIHAGYTGTGAVHNILSTGSGVEGLSINSSTGGTTTLSIRYAMGLHGPAGTTRTLGVLVNGERQTQASFSSTGAWDSWATATVSVSLNAGDNVIDFVKQSQDTGWVNLDFISHDTPVTAIQVQAESGFVVGSSSVTQKHSGYTGTGAVHYIVTTGSGVEDLVVNSSTSGIATLNIRYAMGPHGPAGTTRTLGVLVNGKRQAQASFSSTGAWNAWSTTSVPINVNAGINNVDIIVENGDTGWVNVDYINLVENDTSVLVIEAENLIGSSSAYSSQTFTIDGTNNVIAMIDEGVNSVGELTYQHKGVPAVYDLNIVSFEETDGPSYFKVYVNDAMVDTHYLPGTNADHQTPSGPRAEILTTLTSEDISLFYGDMLKVVGHVGELANAGIDRIELLPTEGAPVLIEAEPIDIAESFKVEAEFNIESGFGLNNWSTPGSSNNIFASMEFRRETKEGVVGYTYNRDAGVYDLRVIAHDENDGVSKVDLLVNGNVIGTLMLDQSTCCHWEHTNNRVYLDVNNVSLQTGDTVKVKVTQLEYDAGYDTSNIQSQSIGIDDARIDVIEFTLKN